MAGRQVLGTAAALCCLLAVLGGCASQSPGGTGQEAKAAFARAKRQCETLMADRALDPIRSKLDLMGNSTPDRALLAEGRGVSSPSERVAVREWARRMNTCYAEYWKPQQKYLPSQQLLIAVSYADTSSALRAQLHNGQLSYGQYNAEREKQRQNMLAALKSLDAAMTGADGSSVQRADQIAQQYFKDQRAVQERAKELQRGYQREHPAAKCEQIGLYLYCAE